MIDNKSKPIVEVLAEALRDLYAMVKGEAPRLLEEDCNAEAARAALARYEAEKAAPKEKPPCKHDFEPTMSGPRCRRCGCAKAGPKEKPQEFSPFRCGACGRIHVSPHCPFAKADPQPALTKCIHCGCYDHGAGNWDCQGNPKWTAQFQPAPSSAEVRAEIRDECERRAEEHAGIVAPVCPTCRDEGEVEDIHAVDGYRPCPTCKPTGGGR